MTIKKGASTHVFGRQRPSANGKHPIQMQPPRDTKFRPLPTDVPGKPPYRLDLKTILPADEYAAIVKNQKLVFHLNGDMGGIMYAVPQELVAKGMESDCDAKAAIGENPAFLYITGDCVYFNGQISEYFKQFYQPYEFYPGPIFAIPGNHDGENLDNDPNSSTLDGFVRNFCAPKAVKMPESQDSHRTAMVQPNVYWTLETPLLNIVGMYSNVPAGGEIDDTQQSWLANELKTLPRHLPLFVALHHPIYSADDYHSGSIKMKSVIDAAAKLGGRRPDAVLAGHVHNYQRLTHKADDGSLTPHLITGAGGYHNLHQIMKVNGETMVAPVVFKDHGGDPVTLEKYSADHHGFLRVEITPQLITGRYYQVPRPQEPYSKGNQLFDYFEYDWKKRSYLPNNL